MVLFSNSNAAPFWRRALASTLDFILGVLLCVAANSVFPLVGGLTVWLLYFPVFESSTLQASPGKYLLGLQVCTVHESPLDFKTALIRNLIKVVSVVAFMLGYFMALVSPQRLTLHDLLAETRIIRGRSAEAFAKAWLGQVKSLWQMLWPFKKI